MMINIKSELTVCLSSVVFAVCCFACSPGMRTRATELNTNFDNSPLESGWLGGRAKHKPFDGGWVTDDEEGYVVVREGSWESPSLRCVPGTLYRVRVGVRAQDPSYWRVFFYDKNGDEIAADHYSRLYSTGSKRAMQEFVFQARQGAYYMRLGFDSSSDHPLYLDSVRLQSVAKENALAWVKTLDASVPPVNYQPPSNRWEMLPQTRHTLEARKKLRVVILGDSIANDLSNSLFHLQVEEMYAGSVIQLIRSVRSGTGCSYYRQDNRVKEYVTDHDPDLVIIGGISHGRNVEAIRDVVDQIRAESNAEILVLTGAVQELTGYHKRENGKQINVSREESVKHNKQFRRELEEMCEAKKVAFLDLRSVWTDYVENNDREESWFRRDYLHANSRGKRVLGQALLRYFHPSRTKGSY